LLVLFSSQIAFSQTKKSLVELQQYALSNNPRLLSMQREVDMAERKIPQSTSLEDPKLKLAVNNLPTSSFSFTQEDMTTKEIGLSQMIPIGKFSSRKDAATREYERARERLRLEKTDILHMIRMYSYELVNIRYSITIFDEMKKQLKLVIDSEVAANKSGTGSLSNVIKANIEYNMIDEDLINQRQKEKETVQKIRYLAGFKQETDLGFDLAPDFKELSLSEIKKAILAANPELKISKLDTEISRDQLAQKKDEYIPDMEVGLSYMQRQNGNGQKRDDMVSGMVTFNIPVWSLGKNSAMIDEMQSKTEMSDALYSDKLNDLNSRAEILVSQSVKWRDLYRLYSEKLIPQTELALETILARYKSNTTEFMPVIDTVRMLLRYRKEQSMALTSYYIAYSEIGKLTGKEVLQ
jgi:outer membrane protein, heavy metal efflux system